MPLPVLVVEDNSINRDVAVLQLKALGYEAECVPNGWLALEAVKSRQYALILMDVMMPDMDGWEASRLIRRYEETAGQHTPIVAVSAWSASDNRRRCFEAGMDDYLEKPYTRVDLSAVLERWLEVV